MQSFYPERFVRDMGCTEAEWLNWLPAAIGAHGWSCQGSRCQVEFEPHGRLELFWRPLPARVIALMRMPRLEVSFVFDDVPETQRHGFMKRFDLYMQRGGG